MIKTGSNLQPIQQTIREHLDLLTASMILIDEELTASGCHEIRRLNTCAHGVLQVAEKMVKRKKGNEEQTGLSCCPAVNRGQESSMTTAVSHSQAATNSALALQPSHSSSPTRISRGSLNVQRETMMEVRSPGRTRGVYRRS